MHQLSLFCWRHENIFVILQMNSDCGFVQSLLLQGFVYLLLFLILYFSFTSAVGSGLFVFFFSSSFATVFSTAVHQPFVSVRKQFIVTDSHCEITVAVSVNSPLKTMAAVQYSKLFAQHETTRLDLEDVLWRSKDDGASRELLI